MLKEAQVTEFNGDFKMYQHNILPFLTNGIHDTYSLELFEMMKEFVAKLRKENETAATSVAGLADHCNVIDKLHHHI